MYFRLISVKLKTSIELFLSGFGIIDFLLGHLMIGVINYLNMRGRDILTGSKFSRKHHKLTKPSSF
jgi:hypothetical protein